MTIDTTAARWRKSSFSNPNGNECVEVAFEQALVGVRDSKDQAGGALVFPARQWRSFVRHTR
ncbi:MAG: DUF397 domain-containing protein [Kibdelosporangium sp.]